MTREVQAWWEATSAYFQADIDLAVGVNWTGFDDGGLALLKDVEGSDVLELGCGGGQCAVALAQRGANVTGIDLSREQLTYARALAAEHDADVALLQADVTDLGLFPDDTFDVAFNAWVFQWVGDLAACFAETYRVLQPGGRFVFTMPHPFYDVVDTDTHAIEESYFNTGRQVTAHDGMDVDQVTYRHTISDVYNPLSAAGFRVDRLLEPGTDDPDAYEEGPWGYHTPELMSKLPATLGFVAVKP